MDRDCIKAAHWSIERIMEDYKKKPGDFEKLFFDMNSQREEGQWNSVWKSDLIHSLMQGYHVPPIHIAKTGTKNIKPMSVFEGKQRITSIREYVLGLFRLHKDTMPVTFKSEKVDEKGQYIYDERGRRIVIEEECPIAGKYFRELPEKLRKLLLHSEVTLNMYFDLTDEEIAVQMERLNRQKKFNGTQTAKVKIGELKASYINDITKNEFFDNRILLSSAKKKSDELSKIVFQSLMVYTGNITNLSNGNIEKFVKNHSEQFDKSILDKINDILIDLDKLLPNNEDVNKLLTSINIPILVFNYDKYEQMLENEEITREEYVQFLRYWFKEGIFSSEYVQYAESTPANKTFVEGRINVMEDELIGFVADIRNSRTVDISDNNTAKNESSDNNADAGSQIIDGTSGNRTGNTAAEEKNTFIKDYLELSVDDMTEGIPLKVLRSVMEAGGYMMGNYKNNKELISYMSTFSDSQQKGFIEQSMELISKIDFKKVDSVIIPQIVRLYNQIKSENIKSGKKIEFSKWVNNLRNNKKYKELILESDGSEEYQKKRYDCLYDDFLRFAAVCDDLTDKDKISV